jgi:hypothetical protein
MSVTVAIVQTNSSTHSSTEHRPAQRVHSAGQVRQPGTKPGILHWGGKFEIFL